MKSKLISLFILLASCQWTLSQSKLPVIKASSNVVDIKEDDQLIKGAWKIVPEAKPDIHSTTSKRITFYTDIDSITFTRNPKVSSHNFIILLNGKDSAYTQIKYLPSYLDKLKKAHKYSYTDTQMNLPFTYQPATDPNLVQIRQELKLDSIAGQGNEISKIINLMYWVHNIVKHDGGSYDPTLRNALDIINICKKENRGVNCRMMATVLNECYLAMDIKSRFVTCLPRETQFSDCHVINMVYSRDLKKWIWMDPTFCAYVMDESGQLLGLSEVRERLITGKTLILNPDANWNRQSSQTKYIYLETYMAKNLYRLECPLVSEYDTETDKNGGDISYVELLPLDGIEQSPRKRTIPNGNYTKTFYKTNNPDVFWKKPY